MVNINTLDFDKIVIDRKNGATYKEIGNKYGVSKWWCIEYLKEIKPQKTYYQQRWQEIETDAKNYLEQKGWENIVNINTICQNAYWDYLAFKNNEKWLIDVTINGTKSSIKKGLQTVDGFRCAVLYYDGSNYNLLEIKLDKLI